MKMKNIFFSGILAMTSSVAFAQPVGDPDGKVDALQLNTITTALPFMAITPGSRAGGMGDAGTALSASANSLYWNTSMLNFSEERSEISVSYTPWLRQLTNDIHLSYISGYYNVNKRHAVGGALRYFSLGEITFTDAQGNVLRNDKPSEFEITGGYAFKLSDKMGVGLNGKFAYSNLTGGMVVNGAATKAGVVGAADISFSYVNDDVDYFGTKGEYTFAATINNIGNKVAYSDLSERDFIPQNLKIGSAFKAKFDKYNHLTLSVELQKLLVPTPARYEFVDGEYTFLSGRESNVGTIAGMIQSFYDAPGAIVTDDNGDYVMLADGSGAEVVGGSKFKEELTEINIAAGLEYWYNDILALRGGFFYENANKGARQYFNFGVGFKYNKFGIDISYLAALKRLNPLANTLRFTLTMALGGDSGDADNIE
jgi:hypothetical protein